MNQDVERFLPLNICCLEICPVRLGGADFPQKLVIELPFDVVFVLNNPLMFFPSDGPLWSFFGLGPELGRKYGAQEPAQANRQVVQTAKKMIGE